MIKIPENLRFRMYPESSIQAVALNRMVTNKEIIEITKKDPLASDLNDPKAVFLGENHR